MKDPRDRIQELLSDLTDALVRGEDRIGLVENYRTEIRNEALEEVLTYLDSCSLHEGWIKEHIRALKTDALAAQRKDD